MLSATKPSQLLSILELFRLDCAPEHLESGGTELNDFESEGRGRPRVPQTSFVSMMNVETLLRTPNTVVPKVEKAKEPKDGGSSFHRHALFDSIRDSNKRPVMSLTKLLQHANCPSRMSMPGGPLRMF